MVASVMAAAAFVMMTRNDPLTLEKQAIYGVEQDGNLLSLACRPEKNEIIISFIPKRYVYVQNLFFPAKAISRFGMEEKPLVDGWTFDQHGLTFMGPGLSYVTPVAKFIDTLGRDRQFNIRYQVPGYDIETATIDYEIDPAKLREFVGMCGPKKVIRKLREIGSEAAPLQ